MAAAHGAIPPSLPTDVRNDVISAIVLAVYERRLHPRDIASRAREFITAHYRQFSKFGPVSLDQPVFDDSNVPLIETIRSDQALWEP
jgi:hypothetical protein